MYVFHFKLQEKQDPNDVQELKKLVLDIKNHEEDFFGTERCLYCLDAGQRKTILENVKKVKKKQAKPGSWVYEPAYSPVLDKLNHFLGSYHQWNHSKMLKEASQAC